MWQLVIQWLVFKVTANQLHDFARSLALYSESRAHTLAHSLDLECTRLIKSALAISLILGAVFVSSLVGIGWILAVAWHSPYRDAILATTMGVPMIIALLLYFYIRRIWRQQPFLAPSRSLWAADWQAVHHTLNTASHDSLSPKNNDA
jgi:hypothetical protein